MCLAILVSLHLRTDSLTACHMAAGVSRTKSHALPRSSTVRVGSVVVQPIVASVAMLAAVGPATARHVDDLAALRRKRAAR